ncbi:MAG: hypothetical protein Q7U86_02935 [Draconibacterium sp.]|nr:hypothetical protein [Draconibacterium sp.]
MKIYALLLNMGKAGIATQFNKKSSFTLTSGSAFHINNMSPEKRKQLLTEQLY